MMKRMKVLLSSILAGLSIALGGTINLSLDNKILGAAAFTIGLFMICTMGFHLYTGKVCYVFDKDKDYALDIPMILIGNFIGTWLTAQLELHTRISSGLVEKASAICNVKLNDDLLSIFILAIFCNILIYVGVEGYNKNPHQIGKYLSLFFGVMVFILCGFEHCVANMCYFSVAGAWSGKAFLYLLVMILGNAVGGVVLPVARRLTFFDIKANDRNDK